MVDPLRVIAHDSGVFLRREAIECGYTDKALARLRHQRVLHRVRHGAYCHYDTWSEATREERHLILARAVRRTTPGDIAFSHTTAALLHGLDVWGADLSRVHVTRIDDGAKRRERDVDHHVGILDASDVVDVAGLPTVPVARSVIEHTGLFGVERGLVVADHALRIGACTRSDLYAAHDAIAHWPGMLGVHVVLLLMDGASESVGESRSRHLFWSSGLPAPELQHRVIDRAGALLGRTDFWWERQRVFGEFDGRVKYGRLLRAGEAPGDVVFREKRREDRFREMLGARCARLTWADLERPRETGERFAEILGVQPLWRRAS